MQRGGAEEELGLLSFHSPTLLLFFSIHQLTISPSTAGGIIIGTDSDHVAERYYYYYDVLSARYVDCDAAWVGSGLGLGR